MFSRFDFAMLVVSQSLVVRSLPSHAAADRRELGQARGLGARRRLTEHLDDACGGVTHVDEANSRVEENGTHRIGTHAREDSSYVEGIEEGQSVIVEAGQVPAGPTGQQVRRPVVSGVHAR